MLVAGILYLNQFRDGLIDARVESLLTQGEIIAGAIAASATVETDSISIDPEKLLELQAGQSLAPGSDQLDSLDFPINPERVAPVLRRLISPTRTRARIYDRDANLLLDSRHLYSRGQILRFDLPPVDEEEPACSTASGTASTACFRRADLPVYKEQPGGNGAAYPEVMNGADRRRRRRVVRISEQGELIVSVAVPIQRFRAVLGVLLLSTQAGDIDKIVACRAHGDPARLRRRRAGHRHPVDPARLHHRQPAAPAGGGRRCACAAASRAARRSRTSPTARTRSAICRSALRDMTNALYDRIEAIESFAADVAHELKNPLTSLRSAVETLPLAKNEDSRRRG